MSGFINNLLSVTLSWIRALISNVWFMINSEDGGAFYRFFRANWLQMVIILCAVCMAVDLLVYFFRWRPDYVWAARWRRLRRRDHEPAAPMQPQEPFYAYQPQDVPSPAPGSQDWQAAQPLDEPVVFDDAAPWDGAEPSDLSWQSDEQPSFGAPRPEPLAYFRDVQAGFAPAIPPEELYAPPDHSRRAGREPDLEPAAVHPGLDEETFRQSVGLTQDAAPQAAPVMRAPVFRPFTVSCEPGPEKPQGALQRFAHRARDLMALDDERKTIRDLQSNVDVSQAFHEPVYPQSFKHNEE